MIGPIEHDMPIEQYVREWVRFQVAYKLSWPLWAFSMLGERALRLHHRVINWGERATRGA